MSWAWHFVWGGLLQYAGVIIAVVVTALIAALALLWWHGRRGRR